MNTYETSLRLTRYALVGCVFHLLANPVGGDTGPVTDRDTTCIAIDFYDMAHRTTSVTGLVQDHQFSTAYPDAWVGDANGEVDIDCFPEHSTDEDPVRMRSFVRDGLRLTGTSATGDARVEFTLPRLPPNMSAPRVAAEEIFLFVTAINARPYQCIGSTLGVVDLTFADGHVESYDLKIGKNVCNWWSGNGDGDPPIWYVFDLDSPTVPEARQCDVVTVNRGLVGMDIVRLVVPYLYKDDELVSIRVTAKPVRSWTMDVSLRLSGITVFYRAPRLEFKMIWDPVTSVSDLWPADLMLYGPDGFWIPWTGDYSGDCYSGIPESYKSDAMAEREVIRNNPHFRCWKDAGPIPAGLWRVGLPFLHQGTDTWRYALTPVAGATEVCDDPRGDFQIHRMGPSHRTTTGCIVISPDGYGVGAAATDPRKFGYQLENAPNALLSMHAGTFKLTVDYSWVTDWQTMYPQPDDWRQRIVYVVSSERGSSAPANLLIEQDNGRKCGYDPEQGEVVNDIEGAQYSGPGTNPQVLTYPLYSSSPVIDHVLLTPVGAGGSYHLEITYNEPEGNTVIAEHAGIVAPGDPSGYFARLTPTAISIVGDQGPPLLMNIECQPFTVRLVPWGGGQQQLGVVGIYTDRSSVDLSAAASGTTYESGNDNVAVVSKDGLVLQRRLVMI